MDENKKHDDQTNQASSSKTFPTIPAREVKEIPDINIITDSQSTTAGEATTSVNADSELTVTAEITYPKGQEKKLTEPPPDSQTPMVSSPVGRSTERTHRRTAKSSDTTPTGSPQKTSTSVGKGIVGLKIEGKLQKS